MKNFEKILFVTKFRYSAVLHAPHRYSCMHLTDTLATIPLSEAQSTNDLAALPKNPIVGPQNS